jgi:raffinose/stachyose/melibiose transport system substrate-binding protein
VIAALSRFKELVLKGYLTPNAAAYDRHSGRDLYFQGHGAFWQSGSWHLFTRGTPPVPADWEYRFFPFPGFAETPERNVAISTGGWNWAVCQQSPHKHEALLFLDYITQPEIAELWARTFQWFLAIRGAVNAQIASPEMLAISQYLEASGAVPGLEHFFHRSVVQEGHWEGSIGVLLGRYTTGQWAERIEELQKASGVLTLE